MFVWIQTVRSWWFSAALDQMLQYDDSMNDGVASNGVDESGDHSDTEAQPSESVSEFTNRTPHSVLFSRESAFETPSFIFSGLLMYYRLYM